MIDRSRDAVHRASPVKRHRQELERSLEGSPSGGIGFRDTGSLAWSGSATQGRAGDSRRSGSRWPSSYLGECVAERAAQAKLLTALIESCRVLLESTAVELFGASVQVTATPDDDETVVLQLDWEFMEFDEQDRFPSDVLAMIPGLESIDDGEYLPPTSGADSPHSWYTYVDRKWIDWFATSAELDDLVALDWEPPNPSSDGSEQFSHLSPSRVVTVGYIEGIEIPGLCGAAVVPHRDPEQLPVCPTCVEALELLRQLRSR